MLVANTALKFIVNFTKNVNSDVRCFYVQQFWRTHTVGYYYIFENELRRLWLTKSVVAPIISTWSGRHFRWCFFGLVSAENLYGMQRCTQCGRRDIETDALLSSLTVFCGSVAVQCCVHWPLPRPSADTRPSYVSELLSAANSCSVSGLSSAELARKSAENVQTSDDVPSDAYIHFWHYTVSCTDDPPDTRSTLKLSKQIGL